MESQSTKEQPMKTHLTYKVSSQETGAAMCGNNSRNYKYGLTVASAKEFRGVAPADRCAHCERLYFEKRNAQRRAKGLPPVSAPFEGLDHAE